MTSFRSLQAESRNGDLSLMLHKLQSEEAGLRDSLAKMSNINEGLAHDKTDLNNLVMQVRWRPNEHKRRVRPAPYQIKCCDLL